MASVNVLGTDKPIQTAKGGTGLDATSVYNVVCGGTTTTGPLQQVASVGTSGHILTSNGAGALPTFQDAGGGGGGNGLDIRTKAWVYDDFLTNTGTVFDMSGMVGSLSLPGHPGLITFSSAPSYITTLLVYSTALAPFKLILYMKDNTTMDPGEVLMVGFFNSTTIASITNGFYFRRTGTDVNWYAVCENSGTETQEDTGIDAADDFRALQIEINSAGTSVDFTIDGVVTNTITTNIPTSSLFGGVLGLALSGTAIYIDALYIENTVPDRTTA